MTFFLFQLQTNAQLLFFPLYISGHRDSCYKWQIPGHSSSRNISNYEYKKKCDEWYFNLWSRNITALVLGTRWSLSKTVVHKGFAVIFSPVPLIPLVHVRPHILSLTSHSFLASPSSRATSLTLCRAQQPKYRPLRGSKPSWRAQCSVVWAPPSGVRKKSLEMISIGSFIQIYKLRPNSVATTPERKMIYGENICSEPELVFCVLMSDYMTYLRHIYARNMKNNNPKMIVHGFSGNHLPLLFWSPKICLLNLTDSFIFI